MTTANPLRTKAESTGLMEAVCERGNLMKAYERVVRNKGAAGVDGIGVQEFKATDGVSEARIRYSHPFGD